MPRPENVRPTDRPRATVQDIVNAAGNLKRVGSQWSGPCPICGGKDRFHVNAEPGNSDQVVLGCRQGCTFVDILEKLGLKGAPGAGTPRRRPNPKKEAVDRVLEAFEGPAPVERPDGVPANAKLEWGEGEDDDGLTTSERYWTWKDADGKPHVEIVKEPEEEVVEAPGVPAALALLVPAEEVAECWCELDLAVEIDKLVAGRLRYIVEEKSWWLFHAEQGWQATNAKLILAAVSAFSRCNYVGKDTNGNVVRKPSTGGRRSTASGAVDILSGRADVLTHVGDWDSESTIMGIPGGLLLDLDTRKQRQVTASDLVRRKLSAAPATREQFEASRTRRLVDHLFADDQEAEYTQRRLGAALADVPGLDDFIVATGRSGCGKGCFVSLLKGVFGSYAAGIPTPVLTRTGNKPHEEWLARLKGARLIVADDLPEGYLDPDPIKRILGSEITAAHKYGASFTFTNNAPILATSNHEPSLRSPDGAVDRRLKPIRCGHPLPEDEQDEAFRSAMKTPDEAAAGLFWILEGLAKYRGGGCPTPKSVRDAVVQVREDTPLVEFTETRFKSGELYLTSTVYEQYRAFMTARGERPVGKNKVSQALVEETGWSREKGAQGARHLRTGQGGAPCATGATLRHRRHLAPPALPPDSLGNTLLGGTGGTTSQPNVSSRITSRERTRLESAPPAPPVPPRPSTGEPMPKRPPDELLAQVRAEWVQAWRDLEHVEPITVLQDDGVSVNVDPREHRPAILRSIAALDMGPPEASTSPSTSPTTYPDSGRADP